MKKAFLMIFSVFASCYVYSQVKSIAIINDVEDNLYILNERLFADKYGHSHYDCGFNQSGYAQETLYDLLSKYHDVDVIEMPEEHRKSRGLVEKSAKNWFKSLKSQYDVVVYIYTCDKNNRQLYYNWPNLYSSGLLVSLDGKENKAHVYTSVTARAFSTETGKLFYFLDHMTGNYTVNQLDEMLFFTNIREPEVCIGVTQILQKIISFRLDEFVEGLENSINEEM